jgi:flagellar biogenesis protein FliO
MIHSTQNIAGNESILSPVQKLIGKCVQGLNRICGGISGAHESRINFVILGRLGLGAGKSLTLVDVAGCKFLVAAGADNISAVIRLESDFSVPSIGIIG